MTTTTYGADRPEARQVGLTEAMTNCLLAREMNEQLYHASLVDGTHDGEIAIFCECELRGCAKRLRIALEEYDRIRRFPTRFVLIPVHTALEGERVVDAGAGFLVVEHTGQSARAAISLDPRRRRPGPSPAA